MTPLTIIGGGFCGTMVLYHLMQQDDLPPLDISWFDETGRHGRGVAYSTPYQEHLLNVPAAGMSALPDDREHFLKWLGEGADPARFYPRMTYGDYLASLMKEALNRGQEKGHKISLLTGLANEAGPDTLTIHATGTSQPLCPGKKERQDPRLIAHPYLPNMTVPPETRIILILGTGLSAVDAILTLEKQNYAGQIICISRNGLWPVAHGPKNKIWHWRRYIDALRPHTNRIWQAMPPFMQRLCLQKITWWNVIRHRMPPECAAILKNLKKSGRLQTHRGAVRDIEISGRHVAVDLGKYKISGDRAINCLGFIPYHQKPAQDFRLSDNEWILGAPLFGHLLETTAVPELREQAQDVANDIRLLLRQRRYLGG